MSVAWVGAGIAAAGVLSSVSAANKQEKAANKAMSIGNEQYQQDREDNLRMYEQQRLDYTPFREVGQSSIRELAARSAPGGEFTKNYERGSFEADPGYLFRLAEGEKGITRAAAARGGLYSGATLKALSRFNQGSAAQEYGAWDQRENTREVQFNQNREFQRNNLATMANIGQTATAGTVQAGQNAQGQISQAGQFNANAGIQSAMNAGEARASGYVGAGNAIGSGIRQWYNANQQDKYMKAGAYNNWANSNSGVMNSTGLSADELAGAF